MSALSDLFTSLANKIRSKTGGSSTYTPTQMVSAIDDVYAAGVASATTPITPSDVSPASMSANTGYKPTRAGYAIESYSILTPSDDTPATIQQGNIYKASSNGKAIARITTIVPSNSSPVALMNYENYNVGGDIEYGVRTGFAIEDYDSVTPSSTPTSVSSGDIVKIGGSGVIVDSIPTPPSITPSDSSPVALTANTAVTPSTNGYAIASNPTSITPSSTPTSVSSGDMIRIGGSGKIVNAITDITPSDSSPVAVTSGLTYKMGGGGYAIQSQPSSKTPDDTTPPSVTSGEIVKMGGAGYLYATQQTETETTLWTNPNPSAAFSAQEVTLSSPYTNFSRIKVYFKPLSTGSEHSVEFTAEEISTWYINGNSVANNDVSGTWCGYNSAWYARRICRTTSSNKLYITVAGKINGSGTVTTTCTPTKITGIS